MAVRARGVSADPPNNVLPRIGRQPLDEFRSSDIIACCEFLKLTATALGKSHLTDFAGIFKISRTPSSCDDRSSD
eukprot:1373958-Prymnesium_polylepis.1